jgi:hypothetical protein
MEFQLQHRVVKGTPVVSLNIVTRAVQIRLLARQIHNARILPTAVTTHPARLRRSLPVAALLFSSPTAPCVMTVTRTRLLACGHLPGQPIDGWCGSVDVVLGHDDEPDALGHEPTWIRPLWPSREQLLHSRLRIVLLEPPTHSPSSATKFARYSCQRGLGRHALIVHLQLIDCGFVGWILLPHIFLNKLLLTDVFIWTVEIHFHVPYATILAL